MAPLLPFNPFNAVRPGLNDPARNIAVVTPNDSNDLPYVARGLYIGTAGTLTITTAGGSTAQIANASGFLPVSATRVFATGTGASGITAFY